MTGFLTVEDVNSILFEYGSMSIFHEINTANITSEHDFDGIKYDFVTVGRETLGDNEYKFTFKIENKLWTGGYYFLDSDGEYIDVDASYINTTKVLSFTYSNESVTLIVYLCNIGAAFKFERLEWVFEEKNINKQFLGNRGEYINYLNSSSKIYLKELKENAITDDILFFISLDETEGRTIPILHEDDKIYVTGTEIENSSGDCYIGTTDAVNRLYFNNGVPNTKSMCPLILTTEKVYLGKINTVSFKQFSSDYYKLTTGVLKYNGEETSIDLSRTGDGCFDLDLTHRENAGDVRFSIHADVVNVNYEWDYDFVLPCEILKASSYLDLSSECGDGGTAILELGGNITLTNDISITHDIKIDGKDHTLDLNQMGFILSENINVTFKNINFINGDTAITQNKGTELRLENCSFTNCQSTNYNHLGSCVYCDIDIESLNNPADFITVIDNCTFIDNQNCILSGGRLTVTNSKLHNTNVDYLDKHNVAFLYQTDGNAVLKHNIFDIDYDTNELCANEWNVGFAQALLQIGTTARINGATSTQLLDDNKLPFSDNVYQNTSHIFAKYYYPQIENCVYTSPVLDKEDKAVCYVVSGENWIWKQNVQVTRASWNSQNEIRKITWEE